MLQLPWALTLLGIEMVLSGLGAPHAAGGLQVPQLSRATTSLPAATPAPCSYSTHRSGLLLGASL